MLTVWHWIFVFLCSEADEFMVDFFKLVNWKSELFLFLKNSHGIEKAINFV